MASLESTINDLESEPEMLSTLLKRDGKQPIMSENPEKPQQSLHIHIHGAGYCQEVAYGKPSIQLMMINSSVESATSAFNEIPDAELSNETTNIDVQGETITVSEHQELYNLLKKWRLSQTMNNTTVVLPNIAAANVHKNQDFIKTLTKILIVVDTAGLVGIYQIQKSISKPKVPLDFLVLLFSIAFFLKIVVYMASDKLLQSIMNFTALGVALTAVGMFSMAAAMSSGYLIPIFILLSFLTLLALVINHVIISCSS